jgi:hypothetical protein
VLSGLRPVVGIVKDAFLSFIVREVPDLLASSPALEVNGSFAERADKAAISPELANFAWFVYFRREDVVRSFTVRSQHKGKAV